MRRGAAEDEEQDRPKSYMSTDPEWEDRLALDRALQLAEKIASTPSASEDRKKELSKLSLYLEECLEFSEQRRTPVRFLCFRYSFN